MDQDLVSTNKLRLFLFPFTALWKFIQTTPIKGMTGVTATVAVAEVCGCGWLWF